MKTTKFLKFSTAVIAGTALAGIMYAQLDIPTNITNAVQTIKEIRVTSDGTNAGGLLLRMNGAGESSMLQVSGSISMGTITGTQTNKISGDRSSVLGGQQNEIVGNSSVIAGGKINKITGAGGVIGGGEMNTINGTDSTIVGGASNSITGSYSSIPGGQGNNINSSYSFAAGKYAQANNQGTFVWSDNYLMNSPVNFTSQKDYTFLIRAQNGVGINTNNPGYALDVNGSGRIANNLIISGSLGVGKVPTTTLDVNGNGYFGGSITVQTNVGVAGEVNAGTVTTPSVDNPSGNLSLGSTNRGNSISFEDGQITVNGTVFADEIYPKTSAINLGYSSLPWNSLWVNGLSVTNGNVGINKVNPVYKLDTSGDINTTTTYRIAGTDYGQYFINSAGTSGQVWKSDGTGRGYWSTSTSTVTETDPVWSAQSGNYVNTTTNQTIAGIKTFSNNSIFNGNVGIGTSPSSKLDVSGEIRTNDKFRIGTTDNYMFSNGGYLGLLSAGNELTIGGSSYTMYINYRAASTYTPRDWIWNAGTSTTYANHTIGSLHTKNNVDVDGSISSVGGAGIGGQLNVGGAIKSSGVIYNNAQPSYGPVSLQSWGLSNTSNIYIEPAAGSTFYIVPSDWSQSLTTQINGNVVVGGNVTAQAFYYSSDRTLKKDLTIISNSLEKINQLNGYYFIWKKDNTKDIGVIAQEVEKIFPDAVKTNSAGLKSVKYGNLIAPVIEAIKELYTKYLDQENKISNLEKRIELLEKMPSKK